MYIGYQGTCPHCNLPQINKTQPPYPCNSARQAGGVPCFSGCGLLGVSLSSKKFLSPPLRSGSCAGFCCTCLLFASVFAIFAPQAPEGLVCGAPVAGALRSRPQTATKGVPPCGILLLVVCVAIGLRVCCLLVGVNSVLFTMNALWSHCYRYITAHR